MNDTVGLVLKVGILGAAGYLGWKYLENSGLLAQWGLSSFPDATSLLTYCSGNPTGTATFKGQTHPCSAWIQAAQSQTTTPPPVTTTPPPVTTPPPPVTTPPSVVIPTMPTSAQLDAWMMNSIKSTSATVDQWCYAANHILAGSCPSLGTKILTCAGFTGSNRATMPKITSVQFLNCVHQFGLSGLPNATGLGWRPRVQSPYRWVH